MTFRHDLDNIVLESLGDTRIMHAVYELEALVLTGEQPLVFSQYIIHLFLNVNTIPISLVTKLLMVTW